MDPSHLRGVAPLAFALITSFAGTAWGHGKADDQAGIPGRAIEFPDTAERLTLAVDLHTHSVFSDGHVWPRIRVAEAIRDGLDAMAITEHLEWQPHLADIPNPDRNRSFEEAVASLPDGSDLILIAGSEITRLEPIGHMNAVFIEDANALFQPPVPTEPYDARAYAMAAGEWPPEAALEAAKRQDAFVFWNHSWWQRPDQKTLPTDFHLKAIREGRLQGIEIANGDTYSPESFRLALDLNLTVIGVSDVHELIDWDYEPYKGGHRPVNLVFAEARTAAAIRAALFEGRTAVWYRNLLLGRERDLVPLITASVTVADAVWRNESSVLEVTFENSSDASFEFENLSSYTVTEAATILTVPPHGQQVYRFRLDERLPTVNLRFRVLNALSAPDMHPEVGFELAPGA